MNELKHQLMLNKDRSWVPCYLKSEADKVIEFWRNESHKHYENWFNLNKQYEGWFGKVMRCERAERELRRQKYKRCLAMAKWCEMCISYWDDDEQEGGWEYKKLRHCIRWKKRWEALAEQFKDKEAK